MSFGHQSAWTALNDVVSKFGIAHADAPEASARILPARGSASRTPQMRKSARTASYTQRDKLSHALDRLGTNVVARREADEAAVRNSEQLLPVNRLVRVPSMALGKVLDGGRAGAHAAKLLAIKASKGPGFTLNEHHCHREYGVSRRAFQAGLRHAKQRGVIDREQHGRRFATEQPLDEGARGFVLIEESLLQESATVLALALAVNLSPTPMRPVDAAKRVGVDSAATIRKLTRQVVKAGAVATSLDDKNTVLVARRGHVFDRIKNDPVKNEPVKNDPAHREREGRTQKKEVNSNSNEKKYRSVTHSRTEMDFQNGFQDEVGAVGDPDWIVLTPWQNSHGLAERKWHATGPPAVFMKLHEWKWHLNAFGTEIPCQLETPAAHTQALEIADELISHPEGREFSGHDAMVAVAFRVARACAEGRTVRSFGFIAQRLLKQLDVGDTSPIHDRPTRRDTCDFEAAYELAIELMAALESEEFPSCRARLLSTAALENLVGLLAKHGRDAFVRGFNRCLHIKRGPGDGQRVWDWGYFEDDISDDASVAPTLEKEEDLT